MRQRLWSRALGIVVAAALLGAVGGTSDLDAFLYHPTGGPAAFDRVLGLERLVCLHLNDSRGARGSHLDRHALIGEGTLGREPFRRIMTDPRLDHVVRIIETPKGEDLVSNDRRMLRRLKAFARARGPAGG